MKMQLPMRTQKNKELPFAIRFYSIVVAMLPVVATYASGIPGFSAADVLLAVCCVIAVLGNYRQRRNTFVVKPILIAVALYLIFFFNLLTSLIQAAPEYVNMLIRTVRYGFYLAVIVLCSQRMFDLELCKKAVKTISLLASVYIFLQFFVYRFFGRVLVGFLPFLDVYVDGYAKTDYTALYKAMYRPTSFFLEPAHVARYVVIGVALFLFDREKLTWKDTLSAIVLSVATLISTSAQGYFLLAIVWFLCMIIRTKTIESNGLKSIFLLAGILMPVLLLGIMQVPFVQTAIARAMNIDFSNLANENTALGARLGGFSAYFELPFFHKLIGMGFGVVPKDRWLSSAAYWLYGSGCIVFLLYLVYGMMCLSRTRGAARQILLIFLILFFSDDSFYSYMCVLFISLSCLKPIERRQPVRRITV